jgi:hypothetical protein
MMAPFGLYRTTKLISTASTVEVRKLLKEIKINRMVKIDNKDYFVLSIYIIDTRILLDMVTESEFIIDFDINNLPMTLKEELLIHFKQEIGRKGGRFGLLVNGEKHSLIGGNQQNLMQQPVSLKVELPEKFKNKPMDFIKYEFKQIAEEVEIKEICLIKNIDGVKCLIQQKHTVPIDVSKKPFLFTYWDSESSTESTITIRELFYLDIEEDKRSLYSCNDNDKMLYGIISADNEISSLEVFTEKRLNGGINYTKIPMMKVEQNKNANNDNLVDHKKEAKYQATLFNKD